MTHRHMPAPESRSEPRVVRGSGRDVLGDGVPRDAAREEAIAAGRLFIDRSYRDEAPRGMASDYDPLNSR